MFPVCRILSMISLIAISLQLLISNLQAQGGAGITHESKQETPVNAPIPLPQSPATFPGAVLINANPPFLAGVAVNHANGVYSEGELLAIRFQAEQDANLYLIYHDGQQNSHLLFPNVAQRQNRVPAKQAVQIPVPGSKYRFRIRPPFGMEVLQVLASTKAIGELDGLITDTAKGAPAISPQVLNKLAGRLTQDRSIWTEHRLQIRTFPKQQEPQARPPKRIGLFIGIGRYKNPKIAANHEELGNSAKVMAQAMLKRGGLDPKLTMLIQDEKATKDNIQKLMLKWLPSVSQPGDTVIIYFSGHSGVVPTDKRNEPDGLDETLAPYDLDAGSPKLSQREREAHILATSISDDTLARWLQALPGRQIALIVDTCHAGGLVGERAFKDLFRDEAHRLRDISRMNIVVLASCNEDEQALFEGTPNKTMYFTYVLAHAVETQPRPLTIQKAFPYAVDELKKLLRQRKEPRVQRPTMTDNALLPVLLVP